MAKINPINPNQNETIDADWLEERGEVDAANNLRQQPYVIDQTYYFRLATYAWCGTVRAVGPQEIVLEPACWCGNSGRWTDAFRDGLEAQEMSELEPVEGRVVVGRYAVVDATPYNHPVPTEQK